jgi:DNA-binding transcriptional regulator GbsR (MarR family)
MTSAGDEPDVRQTSAAQSTVVRFADQIGALWAQQGSTRQTGRVFGYLLFCGRDAVSSDELKEALDASAGGVSTAVRQLMAIGFVRASSGPERRKNYYAVVDDPWTAELRHARQHTRTWVDIANAAGGELAGLAPEGARRAEQLLTYAQRMETLYGSSINERERM